MIERKLSKNKGSVTFSLTSELMNLLGYKDSVFIDIDDNKNIILRKEDIKDGQDKI